LYAPCFQFSYATKELIRNNHTPKNEKESYQVWLFFIFGCTVLLLTTQHILSYSFQISGSIYRIIVAGIYKRISLRDKPVLMKYILVLTCLILCACNNNKGTNKTTDSAANKKGGFELQKLDGVFYDTLPCADCPGIATQLELKPDNSFILEQAYLGKSVLYDLGKWSVTDSILKLTGSEGPKQFKILNHAAIRLLDNEGRMTYDTTSTHIVLSRINTPFKPLQPIPVEGVFSASGDTMKIHICAVDNTYPVAIAPDAMSMKATYNSATHQKNEPVYAKLEGHFELRPSLTDTTTKDFFVVEHFVKFIPGQQCK